MKPELWISPAENRPVKPLKVSGRKRQIIREVARTLHIYDSGVSRSSAMWRRIENGRSSRDNAAHTVVVVAAVAALGTVDG